MCFLPKGKIKICIGKWKNIFYIKNIKWEFILRFKYDTANISLSKRNEMESIFLLDPVEDYEVFLVKNTGYVGWVYIMYVQD